MFWFVGAISELGTVAVTAAIETVAVESVVATETAAAMAMKR